ncbi:polyphenol oxidase family protein [Treponema pectinovorum]|uniref:polyphenol oxidase family protein n=1 Tax=Treponema pectinovorum TaxID=164 RepID=UPI0011C8D850|nr:polyphenol oxidase family protein [Treponema pectinovorum]
MNGVNYLNVASPLDELSPEKKYFLLPFYKDSKPLKNGKRWGMTFLAAGSMRFRWNEKNERRENLLNSIIADNYALHSVSTTINKNENFSQKIKIVPLELIHSKKVFSVECGDETKNCTGDGIVTANPLLMPVLTVADCVPIYFYDDTTGVFGVVHSGWKGTGIIEVAIQLAVEKYGCKIVDICVAIGPHIQSECYFIEKERRDFFEENFGSCTSKILSTNPPQTPDGKVLNYKLSLTKANLNVLKKIGIKESNIVVANECTSCSKFLSGKYIFGSFRRQTAHLPQDMDIEEKNKMMTVQAAFVL